MYFLNVIFNINHSVLAHTYVLLTHCWYPSCKSGLSWETKVWWMYILMCWQVFLSTHHKAEKQHVYNSKLSSFITLNNQVLQPMFLIMFVSWGWIKSMTHFLEQQSVLVTYSTVHHTIWHIVSCKYFWWISIYWLSVQKKRSLHVLYASLPVGISALSSACQYTMMEPSDSYICNNRFTGKGWKTCISILLFSWSSKCGDFRCPGSVTARHSPGCLSERSPPADHVRGEHKTLPVTSKKKWFLGFCDTTKFTCSMQEEKTNAFIERSSCFIIIFNCQVV